MQGIFLPRAAPVFHPPLHGNRIGNASELLRPHKDDRKPGGSVAREAAGMVLCHALLERAASRADVVAAIGTAEHVDESSHPWLHAASALDRKSTRLNSSH